MEGGGDSLNNIAMNNDKIISNTNEKLKNIESNQLNNYSIDGSNYDLPPDNDMRIDEEIESQSTDLLTLAAESAEKQSLDNDMDVESSGNNEHNNSEIKQTKRKRKSENEEITNQEKKISISHSEQEKTKNTNFNTTNKINKVNKYSDNNKGPYIVYIEPINTTEPNKNDKIHPTTVGRIISKKMRGQVKSVSRSGAKKVTVTVASSQAANLLVEDKFLSSYGLRASIPYHKITKQGLIRNVPLDIPDEEILEEIKQKFPVINVKRFTQRNHNYNKKTETSTNTNKFVPSKTVLLTFDGQNLPEVISLYGSLHRVSVYIPRPKICFSCFRYNHIKTQCKSQVKCMKCGEDKNKHDKEELCKINEDEMLKCINCGKNHLPTDRICLEYKAQEKIKYLIVAENRPFAEAKNIVYDSEKVNPSTRFNRKLRNTRERNLTSYNQFPPLSGAQVSQYSQVTKNPQNSPTKHSQKPVQQSLKSEKLRKEHQDLLIYRNGRNQSYTKSVIAYQRENNQSSVQNVEKKRQY